MPKMKSSLTAVGGALKLGFFVSGLTIASLAARFATADIPPDGPQRAQIKALAERLDGRLSDDSLRRLLESENRPLFSRFDPGLKQPANFSAVHPFEGSAPNLHLFDLAPNSAQTINASLPFSLDPNPPARPFILAGSAEDRATALTCLTQAVYYEAGFEPETGEQAVAQVVLNRMRHPIFPHSVCGVVYQGADLKTGCQFSFTCDGSLARTPQPAAWLRARAVAEQALNGFVMKTVGGATHYHTQWVVPWWQPTVSKVAQVGAHIFYRWPGSMGLPGAFAMHYAGGERIAATPTSAGLRDPGAPTGGPLDGQAHVQLAVADMHAATPVLVPTGDPAPADTAAASRPAVVPPPTLETVDLSAEVKPDLKVTPHQSFFGKPKF